MTAACGTYAGAQRHARSGEPVCAACKEARRQYTAAYRKSMPVTMARQRRQAKARARALAMLAAAHPQEYELLLARVYGYAS